MNIVSPSRRCSLIAYMIFNFIFLPITMLCLSLFFFGAMGTMAAMATNEKCFKLDKRRWREAKWWWGKPWILLLMILELAIFGSLAICIACLTTAIVIGPAYICQLFRLIKILMLWCCKTNDKKEKK